MPTTRESATKVRFTAFSISSMHRNMMIAFLRTRTPNAPITNRIAERTSAGVVMAASDAPLGEHESADDRHQQQDAGDLEGHDPFGVERPCDRADHPALRDQRVDRLAASRGDGRAPAYLAEEEAEQRPAHREREQRPHAEL